nr:SulP family inorganic anion transporter [Actinopolyspora erythraea]
MSLPAVLRTRPSWLSPRVLRTEVLSGLVVALALIPEAISFSIIAGVDPRVGLFASFTMAVTISLVGGRRAMISAATGRSRWSSPPWPSSTAWSTWSPP